MRIKFDEKVKETINGKGKMTTSYIILLTGMFCVSLVSLAMTYKTYSRYNKEEYKSYNNENKETEDVNVSANEIVVEKKDAEEELNKKIEEEKQAKEEEQEIESIPAVSKATSIDKTNLLEFQKPLEGEIIKKSSIDEVVYWETLDVWKIHEGIDIAAEEGTIVKAIEAGKVVGIKTDPIFGKLILINHGQSYLSIYCNLDETVSVKEGTTVKKGQSIGKVGSTAYGETKEESHLHFELMKDSVYIDPETVIDFK